MRTLEKAWIMWQTETGRPFPLESEFSGGGGAGECNSGIKSMSATYISTGYLQHMPMSPVSGRNYMYDNDDDSASGTFGGGVNIIVTWCGATEYQKGLEVAKMLDGQMDNNNGATAGRVRWGGDATGGGILFNISTTSTTY